MKKRRRPAGSVTGAAKASLMQIRVTAAEKRRIEEIPSLARFEVALFFFDAMPRPCAVVGYGSH